MRIKKNDNFFDVIFSMLLFSLSLSIAVPNILFGVLILVFIFKKYKEFKFNVYIKLMSLFVFYILIKALFFGSFIENINLYKFQFILLLLTILTFHIKNIIIVINGYVFGVFLGVLISLFKIGHYFLVHKNLPFGNTSEVQNLILVHRPFFGFMCLLAVVLTDYLLFKTNLIRKKKIGYFFVAILIIAFLYTIVARLSLFLLCVYIIIRILIHLRSSRTKLILSLLAFLISVVGVLYLNKNLKDRLHIKGSYSKTFKVLKNQEPRFVIWKCFDNQIKDDKFNFYFGYNNRKFIQENLNKCYGNQINSISKKKYYLETKFNSHNQFFDILLDAGFVGLILFFEILVFTVYSFRGNFYAVFLVISFISFMIFENLFHRQLGAYLFGIFIPLFYKIVILEKK